MRDNGIVENFPWLPFTILNKYYIDHHFLYHAFLAPFTYIVNPFVGAKLFTALMGSSFMLLFYWLLKKLGVYSALLFSILLATTYPFIFRINLVKAPAFSLIFIFIAFYLITARKYISLFFLSFAYVWSYGGWPLILVLAILFIISDSFVYAAEKKEKIKKTCKFFIFKIFSIENIKIFLSIVGGLAAGIIINPYFPKNLYFYWEQIIQIAIINYQDKIGVGSEWYPYKISEALSAAPLIFILLLAGFVSFLIFLFNDKKIKAQKIIFPLFAGLLSLFFLFLIFKSRRHIEYLIPFSILFSALSINLNIPESNIIRSARTAWKNLGGKIFKTSFLILFSIFIILCFFIFIRDIKEVKKIYENGYKYDRFQEISAWLERNSKNGEVVFHNDWDDFPILFYNNDKNYYIVGLDPTFMYNYNEKLYWQWVNITLGKTKNNLYNIIKKEFDASYILIDKQHEKFKKNIENDSRFIKTHESKDGFIYKVK